MTRARAEKIVEAIENLAWAAAREVMDESESAPKRERAALVEALMEATE